MHSHIYPNTSLLNISEVINIIEENSTKDITIIFGLHEDTQLKISLMNLSMVFS